MFFASRSFLFCCRLVLGEGAKGAGLMAFWRVIGYLDCFLGYFLNFCLLKVCFWAKNRACALA